MPWVLLAIVVWVLGLLAVPQPDFRRLVPFGIVAGFGLGLLVNILGSSVFGLWGFGAAAWPILGIPFWAVFTSIPAVIVFVYYLPGGSLGRLAWLLAFPTAFTVVDFLYLRAGYRFFSPDWNLVLSFFLSLGLHILILSYYLTSVREPERVLTAGATEAQGRETSEREPGGRGWS